jgi:hypothetical protein
MFSEQLKVDDVDDAIELFHRKGWTDGLPIVPPTADRVAKFLQVAGRDPTDRIGFYELRKRPVTAEKLAINAVMAGCLPEHLTVLIAIVECMLDPAVNSHTANASTGSLPLAFAISGPIAKTLGMNWNGNVLGPGNRANSSIGRAVRLVQLNIMGSIPGAGGEHAHGLPVMDRSTMGHPAKYAGYHVVENDVDFPTLTPLRVEEGYELTDSTVSLFCAGNHVMMSNHAEQTPDEWIDSVAHYLVGTGRLIPEGAGMFLIPPEAAAMFVDAGWTKAAIAQAIVERTRRSVAWVKSNGWKIGGRFQRGGPIEPGDEDRMLSIAGPAKAIRIIVCGGPAGNFPVFIYSYGPTFNLSTRKIKTN